jgi:hypothetical protein
MQAAPTAPSHRDAMARMVAYANCMRSHGVSDFPDPTPSTSNGKPGATLAISSAVANSPAFSSAQKACQRLLPEDKPGLGANPESQAQVAAQVKALLAFAACMRKHGIGNFPDPTSQGDLNLDGTGINQYSPTVLAAGKICLPTAGGFIGPPTSAKTPTSAQSSD